MPKPDMAAIIILVIVATFISVSVVNDSMPVQDEFVLHDVCDAYDHNTYATSNNGKVLFRLEQVPNDDPIWVLVRDDTEYSCVIGDI